MKLSLAYRGRSGVEQGTSSASVHFAPNLLREPVAFDGGLRDPIRFREAVSALHEIVVGDLRFKKRDRTAYEEWKKEEAEREVQLRTDVFERAKQEELARAGSEPVPPNLDRDFRKMHGLYWRARWKWADELRRLDPDLWRHLVPCDPVVTVAPDVVMFECFAKDESSYGCLSVSRDAFDAADAVLGTTNVDYSLALFEHFQTLRSYRPTRFVIDPKGFEVQVEGAGYREEKIDLPPSWLRGFGQIQAATTLPFHRVQVPVEAMYSILAYLKRHREKSGPRSIRFILTPGAEHRIVLEPWQVEIPCRGTKFLGDKAMEVKIWGRRRLMTLARVLPLADRIDVALLGTGMPSIWVVTMGDMRLTLALSGWTAADWTSGTNLELLGGKIDADPRVVAAVGETLQRVRRAGLPALVSGAGASDAEVVAALHLLAKRGQLVYDFGDDVYRFRSVMPFELSDAILGPESPELAAARTLVNDVKIERSEELAGGRKLSMAKVGGTSCELILDADGNMSKARCTCKHFHKFKLRTGPCRHLTALRMVATKEARADSSFLQRLSIR